MVELSGNATLTIITGMLQEISVRHTAFAMRENRPMSRSDYDIVMRSHKRLMALIRSGNGPAAEAHWRKHLDVAHGLLFKGMENVKVRDVMR
jgi:DNA-binding FadR family transcriptional regulator